MGLNVHLYDLLARHCRCEGGSALIAGYPDLYMTEEELYERSPHVVGGLGLIQQLGYPEITVVDLRRVHGCEVLCDLNYPQELGQHDLVVDHGTVEHCVNVGQAAVNLTRSVKIGGYMAQHAPIWMLDHGFYNLNPCWFREFYDWAGFDQVVFTGYHQLLGELPVPSGNAGAIIPHGMVLTVVAKRVRPQPEGFPIQGIYR